MRRRQLLQQCSCPLMHDDHPILMSGNRRVNEFSRENRMSLRQHQQHQPELAALRFMYSQSISKFKRGFSLLTKVASVEIVGKSLLRRKLDLEDFRIATRLP